ncbi:Probable transcriptional regulatory protein HI_0315 [Actinobacillus equuli]|nr:Probable transcriptional regulatory protein HI_0315 [Actinobacillus equuli]
MIPSTTVELDAETAPKLLDLINRLEDCDDVQTYITTVKSVTKLLHCYKLQYIANLLGWLLFYLN